MVRMRKRLIKTPPVGIMKVNLYVSGLCLVQESKEIGMHAIRDLESKTKYLHVV